MEACRAYKAVHGQLPCRVTIFFDRRVDVEDPAEPPIREKIMAEQNGKPVVASMRRHGVRRIVVQ